MHTWQLVWRQGIAPCLDVSALRALRRALATDDPALLQGVTSDPPPLDTLAASPVEGACPLALAGWRGEHLATVAEVEEYFARVCGRATEFTGDPEAAKHFVCWWDNTDRDEARRALLAEVEGALVRRGALEAPAAVA